MSENRIRKIDSSKTNPTQSRAPYGPQSAGIEYDAGRNGLSLNPDGVVRLLPTTFFETEHLHFGNGQTILTAADFGVFFTAPFGVEIVSVKERHEVLGTDAGAVTVMVKKVPSGTAKGSGTDTLAAGVNMKATADTNQAPALHATKANYQLAAGDSLALVATGTLTALNGVEFTVELKRRPDVA